MGDVTGASHPHELLEVDRDGGRRVHADAEGISSREGEYAGYVLEVAFSVRGDRVEVLLGFCVRLEEGLEDAQDGQVGYEGVVSV